MTKVNNFSTGKECKTEGWCSDLILQHRDEHRLPSPEMCWLLHVIRWTLSLDRDTERIEILYRGKQIHLPYIEILSHFLPPVAHDRLVLADP